MNPKLLGLRGQNLHLGSIGIETLCLELKGTPKDTMAWGRWPGGQGCKDPHLPLPGDMTLCRLHCASFASQPHPDVTLIFLLGVPSSRLLYQVCNTVLRALSQVTPHPLQHRVLPEEDTQRSRGRVRGVVAPEVMGFGYILKWKRK